MKPFPLLLASLVASPAYASTTDQFNVGAGSANRWTGWFLGANVGYSWGDADATYEQAEGGVFGVDINAGSAFTTTRGFSPESGNVGLQAGYDYQLGDLVVGVTTDFSYRGGAEKLTIGPIFPPLEDFLTIATRQEWLGSLRTRIGFMPLDTCLVYATGGLAYGRVQHAVAQTTTFPGNRSDDSQRAFSDQSTKIGYTVGAGMEYRLNSNWSIGAEYLYVDLGADSIEVGPSPGSQPANVSGFYPATRISTDDSSSTARVLVNYRFDGL